MILNGKDVTGEPLTTRTQLQEEQILAYLGEPIRSVGVLEASLSDLIVAVRAQGLEGLIATPKDSLMKSDGARTSGRRCV